MRSTSRRKKFYEFLNRLLQSLHRPINFECARVYQRTLPPVPAQPNGGSAYTVSQNGSWKFNVSDDFDDNPQAPIPHDPQFDEDSDSDQDYTGAQGLTDDQRRAHGLHTAEDIKSRLLAELTRHETQRQGNPLVLTFGPTQVSPLIEPEPHVITVEPESYVVSDSREPDEEYELLDAYQPAVDSSNFVLASNCTRNLLVSFDTTNADCVASIEVGSDIESESENEGPIRERGD